MMSETALSYTSLPDYVLAELVKNGDDKAFNELSVRYIGTIGRIARKFSAEGYEHNDFVQEGLIGLLHSCRNFNFDKSVSFSTYMSIVIERRFISIIRSSNTARKIPRSNIVFIDEIDDSIEDVTQGPEEQLMLREHISLLFERLADILSNMEFKILMLYGNGFSYSQISNRLSVSEKTVDNALQRARRKISAHNFS